MHPLRRRAAGVALLSLCCAAAFTVCAQTIPVEPSRAVVALVNSAGKRYTFSVEIADSPGERRQGLMFREALAQTHGMLFLYQPAQKVSIWMKNTLLPLDILFIDTRGRIARIEHLAEPLSERAMSSGTPVRAVLEINGGMAEFLDVAPGDRVIYGPLWPETAP